MFPIKQPEHGSLVVDGMVSEALRGRASFWAYLPPGYDEEPDRRYPVLYLLHGAWGWEWDWAVKGDVGGTVGRLINSGELEPLIVVMPNDGLKREGTFYVNWVDGSARYEDWIARDLVGYIDANLRTKSTRADRCISGLSMGGFGAFHVGLRNRNLYRSVASHSGLFDVAVEGSFWDEFRDQAFGSMEKARAASPYHFVADIPKAELPALYHDCGTEDFLFGANEAMHARLEELGVASTYRTFPGAHTWEYWTEHLVDSLAFHFPKA